MRQILELFRSIFLNSRAPQAHQGRTDAGGELLPVEPQAEVTNPSVANAWDRGIAGFIGVIAGVIVGLGYLLPILVIAVVAWFVVRVVRRRRAAA